MMTHPCRIALTPGEPAGIGIDIAVQIAQQYLEVELFVIADPEVLHQRAQQLQLPLKIIECSVSDYLSKPHIAGQLHVIPVQSQVTTVPGKLDVGNAHYVMQTLKLAAQLCMCQFAHAVVTGPVHKGILNQAGIDFYGHTEFFMQYCDVPHVVMLFVVDQFRVALATTHLPLSYVPSAITEETIENTVRILYHGLQQDFGIYQPRLFVCGLNPHAGEDGYLGREEIDIIVPTLEKLKHQGWCIEGPLSADTIFTPQYMQRADAIVAMYHDQALPLIKHLGWNCAVNVTLGLPWIRTSVDHGTALNIAGSGRANAGSLVAAIHLAMKVVKQRATLARQKEHFL